MSKIADVYTKEVHNNLSPYYATWRPDFPVRLGDFGTLNHRCFDLMGNVEDMGIKFSKIKGKQKTHQIFASKGSAKIKFHAKGNLNVNGVVNVNPAMEVGFTKGDSVFFNAAGCTSSTIRSKYALGQALKERHSRGREWLFEWVVVTEAVVSKAATILVSSDREASCALEATVDVPNIDLADGSLGFKITKNEGIAFKLSPEPGTGEMTVLIGLHQLITNFWSSNIDFRYKCTHLFAGEDIARTSKSVPSEDLFFIKLGKDPTQPNLPEFL